MRKTSSRANDPFASLLPLVLGAKQVGPTPWGMLTSIELRFHTGAVVPLPLAMIQPSPAEKDDELELTRCQRRIIEALHGGQKKLKKQLKAIPGVGNHVYMGLRDLEERGLIEQDGEGYRLTEEGEEIMGDL